MPSRIDINSSFAKLYLGAWNLNLNTTICTGNCWDFGKVSGISCMDRVNFELPGGRFLKHSWSLRYKKFFICFMSVFCTYFLPQRKSRKKICILVLVLSVIAGVFGLIMWIVYGKWLPQSLLPWNCFQGQVLAGVLPQQTDHKRRAYTRMPCNNLVRN